MIHPGQGRFVQSVHILTLPFLQMPLLMAGHSLSANCAVTDGLQVSMDFPMPPTLTTPRPDIKWRWIIPHQPTMRIDNYAKWLELVQHLQDMPDEARIEVLESYQWLCRHEGGKPYRLTTCAELCLERAIKEIHDKYSPTKAGADEYAEIMEANAELWWTNREIDRGR
jgi:hypothetical protein